MAAIVVVFDFDKTIIDCDSDNWVVDALGATQLFDDLLKIMPWNSAMDAVMRELHAQGRTVDEIAEAVKTAPFPAKTIAAVRSAHALGCELRIVSDANRFFIETILKHHGLMRYFAEINTNPGFVDEEGRLRILPYHDFNAGSHGCNLCPPNMCKSKVVERIRKSSAFVEGTKRMIYLGDGKGDYCPSLRLGPEDCVMPRKNYPLWELIAENPRAVRAEIREWSNADDLERILIGIIEDSISAGWKFERMALLLAGSSSSPHEAALPKVLPVPN